MENGIDFNKIIAELIQMNLKELVKHLPLLAKRKKSGELKKALEEYLFASLAKYSKVKTILYSDASRDLYDFYVPLDVENSNGTIESVDIDKLSECGNFIILTGTAGSGKSTLMKHLFLDTIKNSSRIPLFVELKTFNLSENSIIHQIYDQMSKKLEINEDTFKKFLKSGRFTILLDGLDELYKERRKTISKEILELSDKYQNNYIFISSRPDKRFISWNNFIEYQVAPLTKGKACLLIQKLDYDKVTKTRFHKDLSHHLYKQHKYFLSNPLLLTIMLLTYHQYADIPNKKSLFFTQAFEALFCKHDATKDGYIRKIYSNLPMDDFSKVLSAFSISTYYDHKISFSETDAIEYLNKARKISNISFNIEDLLKDMISSVCILLHDGLFLTYSHRSFQEYFAAMFIANTETAKQKQLLERFADFRSNETLIALLFEINSLIVEKYLIIPELEKLEESINFRSSTPKEAYIELLSNYFPEIKYFARGGFSFDRQGFKIFQMFNFLNILYNEKLVEHHSHKIQIHKKHLEKDKDSVLSTAKLNQSDILEFMSYWLISSNGLKKSMKLLTKLRKKHSEHDLSFNEIFSLGE